MERRTRRLKPAAHHSHAGYRHGESGLVFWLLLGLALAAFVPCILLPEWRAYQAIQIARQSQQHRLDQMQRVVERERRLIVAMQSDPAVIARMAQRELRYQQPDSEPVMVFTEPVDMTPRDSSRPAAVSPPTPGLTRVLRNLPDYNYDTVFCDEQIRVVIVAMCVALMGVALWQPRRRYRTQGPKHPSDDDTLIRS